MPKPTPIPVRRLIYDLWKKQWKTSQIAEHLQLPVRTVRNLIRRFAEQGEGGLEPSYRTGPRPSSPDSEPSRQAAEALRREHPRWGAGLIAVYLNRNSDTPAPSVRTVQRWLAQAGLSPAPRGRRPRGDLPRATDPHQTWQLDAAEEIRLETGQKVSWLRVADECTGAVLETRVFPLGTVESRFAP